MDETKSGNRNNAQDRQRIRQVRQLAKQIVDVSVELEPTDADPLPETLLIADIPGTEVKATRLPDSGVKLGGYLVRYGGVDLMGEYFGPDTDFGGADSAPVYFHHGQAAGIKNRRLGRATLQQDEFGIFAETILQERDEYEKFIVALAEAGKLGWSSGTAAHLMQREEQEDGRTKIVAWPIAEASLTHIPAEPRNTVAIKSITGLETLEDGRDPSADDGADAKSNLESPNEEVIMTEVTITEERLQQFAREAAAEALKSLPAQAPRVEVITDAADQPWENDGQFFKAVRIASTTGHRDPRLERSLKATGMSEGVPADGGYLLPPQMINRITERMYGTGRILSRVQRDPVTGNSITINVLDETSRANGSRYGGVLGYWVAEGGTLTASKPKFAQQTLRLHKVSALCYMTDELIDDVAYLESFLSRVIPEELMFQSEDAIWEGTGTGQPLGIMNSPALVTVTRADANKIAAADIWAMYARRWVGGRYAWYINQDIWPQLYALGNTYQNMFIGPAGMPNAPAGTLMGLPVVEVEYASTLGTVGDIVLADFGQYQVIDKRGIQQATSIHVSFVTEETAYRFTYRIDGQPLWYSALTPFKGTNTVSPFVALSTSS